LTSAFGGDRERSLALVLGGLVAACGQTGRLATNEQFDAGSNEATLGAMICADLGDVPTSIGALRGMPAGDTCAFLGVPYAQAPVGEYRFVDPPPPEPHEGVRLVQDFGPPCMQLRANGDVVGSEDCLTLNIWTPGGTRKPVVFFIHGGGNVGGGSAERVYEGRHLSAAADIVLVTINYRLGPLGYFEHPELPREYFGATNAAFGDQNAALKWVMQNIEVFGGDPNNVLVYGQSAGARAVCAMLKASFEPVFAKAIVSSASCEFVDCRDSAAFALEIADELSCGDLDCLRQVSAEDLVRAKPSWPSMLSSSQHNLCADNEVSSSYANLPLLFGSNSDESLPTVPDLPTVDHYRSLLRAQFGLDAVDDIWAMYFEDADDPRRAYGRVLTDVRYTCPIAEAARHENLARDSSTTYRYLLNRPLDSGEQVAFGAYHGLDLLYVFGTFAEVGYSPSEADLIFSASMMQLVTEFARSGIPTFAGVAAPPAYGSEFLEDASNPFASDKPLDRQSVLALDDVTEVEVGPRDTHCGYWAMRGQ
jgi:para-nitrobenzyl esterase